MNSTTSNGNSKILTNGAIVLGICMIFLMGKLFADLAPKDIPKVDPIPQPISSNDGPVSTNPPSSDLETLLEYAANEVNKKCPMMVDQITRLDNAMAMPNNEFQYNYTLMNIEAGSLDIATLGDNIRPTLVNMIRTHPDLKFFRDNKTTMSYLYNDKNGVYLLKISIDPDEYSQY